MQASKETSIFFNINFIAASAVNLLVMVAYYLLFVVSSPYAAEKLHATPSAAGFVAGAMVLGCLSGRFVTGGIIDRFGFKKMIFFGLFVYTGSMLLYLITDNLPLLIANRLIGGIGVGCVGTVTGALIAYVVPQRQLGLGISYFSLSTLIALALGPFMGIFLMDFLSYQSIFILCSVFGAVAFLLAMLISASIELKKGPGGSFRLSDYIEYRSVPISATVLLGGVCYGCVQAFIAFHAREAELVAAASLFFLFYAITAFCSRPFTGRLLDARGENLIIYPALLLTACSLLLLAVATAEWEILLAGALLGIGYGNFQSTAQAVSVKIVPRTRFGQATSTFFIFLDLGIGFGPYLLGFVAPIAGYKGLYLLTAGIALAAVPLYHFLHGSKRGAPESCGDDAP